jgi:hypothetical protein
MLLLLQSMLKGLIRVLLGNFLALTSTQVLVQTLLQLLLKCLMGLLCEGFSKPALSKLFTQCVSLLRFTSAMLHLRMVFGTQS